MFNLPQITKEQLDEFLDEIEGQRSVAGFLTEDSEIDYDKLHKVYALMTEEYLTERAQRGSRSKFEAALAKVPDVEPDEEDRL